MSDSRLEKFIYAICSMDVSDLPVPLSRIEKLWNCLITGETPDFEPLSRNEKYLMAMLDRYDISNLPAPMSRGEKLLYKIAVGETDLSDVPGYLSRYEELLKYLIENGKISEDDFEYVLYTLNQSLYTLYTTAEKPVKSAILKGQTLVNYFKPLDDVDAGGSVCGFQDGKIVFQFGDASSIWGSSYTPGSLRLTNSLKVSPNTKYFAKLILSKPIDGVVQFGHFKESEYSTSDIITLKNNNTNIYQAIMTTRIDTDYIGVILYHSVAEIVYGELLVVPYQEGMENWDIPYFEGMQSVKMPVLTTTGKNLFNPTWKKHNWYPFKIKKGTKLTLSTKDSVPSEGGNVCFKDKNNKEVWFSIDSGVTKNSITLQTDIYQISNMLQGDIEYQMEYGSATEYEPYKSNILTANEVVTLRGIGDVQDTLDCLTGEVTESIREIVLDGTQYMDADGRGIYIQVDDMKKVEDYRAIITCDKLPVFYHQWDLPNVENGIAGYLDEENKYPGQNWLYIKVNNSIDVGEVRQILTQNPITVQYGLSVESIKTVDLTVVDQDNQPTELGTFENVTHVSLVAENLIPEVEMEVATNLLEDTVFNLTNAFNTLYPTAEKPVKSAILKGNTWVNINRPITRNDNMKVENGFQILTTWSTAYNLWMVNDITLFKTNTKYYIIVEVVNNTLTSTWSPMIGSNDCVFLGNLSSLNFASKETGIKCATFTTKSDFTNTICGLRSATGTNETVGSILKFRIAIIEYQEGMENWDIPYFEGMQSVKMPVLTTTGKNLFDKTKITANKLIIGSGVEMSSTGSACTDYIPVEAGKTYIRNGGGATIAVYDTDKNFIERMGSTVTFTATANGYIRWNINSYASVIDTMQIEEGTTTTTYEPYKTNILTVNEDVELRGIGDVQDTLDLISGEIIESIGEDVLNGSEEWIFNTPKEQPNHWCFHNDQKLAGEKLLISDRFPQSDIDGDRESIRGGGNFIFVYISKEKVDGNINSFKQWLSQNPIKYQYRKSEKSIKTVDLTVVDQDNQPTQLGTFENLTHVLLDSEGLIPNASLTVRTKIPTASSTNLLMDTVSTEQEQLNMTVNEQSENVDATMIATTEIFEETL